MLKGNHRQNAEDPRVTVPTDPPRHAALETEVAPLIRDERWEEVAAVFAGCHPADIAVIINRSPQDAHNPLFSLVDDAIKPEVLAELESVAGTDVLASLTNSEISDIVEDMAPDDAADLLGDLPETRSERVLALMEKEDSEDVRRLLEFDEDSAGGIMTTDVVAMAEDQTVAEAVEAIAYVESHEPFYHANILDREGRLIGFVDIWELLRERNRGRPLRDLVHRDFIAAHADVDQEEVARLMNKYDLAVIPVVDSDNRLLGRVTADDVIDVMQEEASEDIFRLAGSDDAELENASVLKSCLVRLPWLMITLVGGFITSVILRSFHARISEILILAAFVPIVLAMGGNTGIQSSTLIVRSLAIEGGQTRSILRLLLREILIGAVMGLACGAIIGIWAGFVIGHSPGQAALSGALLAGAVAVSLFTAMTFAAVFGALVPILLNRMRVDPAVASGPFVTITNDIAALLIYFGITALIIHRFAAWPS